MRKSKRLRFRLPLSNLIVAGSVASVFALSSPAVRANDEGKKEPVIGWQKDVSKVEIPKRPAAGMVRGHQFNVEKATLGGGLLSLRQGKKFFVDAEFLICTFLGEESLEGKKFHIAPSQEFGSPHIHVKDMPADAQVPKGEAFTEMYSMSLEFGMATKEGIPAKIFLCVPDEKKRFVAGSFLITRDR